MSLILEALRKSEAERRRGQVPGLHAERAPASPPARATRPAWPWLALAIMAVLALAWLARGAWSPPPAIDVAAGVAGQPASAAAAVVEPGARGMHDAGAGDPDDDAPRSSDAAPAALNPASLAGTPPSPRVADNSSPAAGDAPAPAPAPNSAPASPRVTPAAMPIRLADADASATATAVTPRLTPGGEPAMRIARAPAPVPAPARAPTSTSAAATPGAPLRLSDLSTAERLELPPLKMSMHMWDPAPARRFAIIDGARVNEGDRLGDAVVDEITTGAVLLAWRGQRLQIPLR